MKKILIIATTSIIALTSSVSASDTDALTKAVVKIIKSQYNIQNRLTKLERNQGSSKNTKSSNANTAQLQKEIVKLNKRIAALESRKVKTVYRTKPQKTSRKRKSQNDKIIEDFLR